MERRWIGWRVEREMRDWKDGGWDCEWRGTGGVGEKVFWTAGGWGEEGLERKWIRQRVEGEMMG